MLALSDSSGAAFATYAYDAWGNPLARTAVATGSITASLAADIASRQPLRYAGYVWDTESNTYYCSARQYDPVTAQFLAKDPAKADGEESAYQYAGGDPVGSVDPSGEWGKDVHYKKTKEWCSSLTYSEEVAASDWATDDGLKGIDKWHGRAGSETAQRTTFKAALGKLDHHRPKAAAKLLGTALHTLQDRYAHRRILKRCIHMEGMDFCRWSEDFTHWKKKDIHTYYHDDWSQASSKCRRLVKTKSKALIKKFKNH